MTRKSTILTRKYTDNNIMSCYMKRVDWANKDSLP